MMTHAELTTISRLTEAAARAAGEAILKLYRGPVSVSLKGDGSPLTLADQQSHEIIVQALAETGIPVVSEEAPDLSGGAARYWLVDPLDGTKEFVASLDEFTVNIALVDGGAPRFGLVYAPVLDELYAGAPGYFAWWKRGGAEQVCGVAPKSDRLRMAVSRFHDHPDTGVFARSNDVASTIPIGAALKYGRLAAAEVDVYLRLVGTAEWDTGAGQAGTRSGRRMPAGPAVAQADAIRQDQPQERQFPGLPGAVPRHRLCGCLMKTDPNSAFDESYFKTFYHEDDPRRAAMYEAERARIERLTPAGRILDVGCGLGLFLSRFAPERWARYGAEISAHAITEARRRGIHVNDYAQAYDYADGFFDVIVFRGSLQLIRTPFAVIETCVRLLAPGGYMVFLATPNSNSPYYRRFKTLPFLTPKVNYLIPSDLMISNALKNFGLDVVDIRYPYLETPYARPLLDHVLYALSFLGLNRRFAFWRSSMEIYARKPADLVTGAQGPPEPARGAAMLARMRDLWPFCRSITGNGVRRDAGPAPGGVARARRARGPHRDALLRLDDPRRVEHPRCLGERPGWPPGDPVRRP